MGFFKSMKLRTRLVLAFVLMSLVAAIVGGVGYVNMRDINDMTNRLYEKELLGLKAAADARTNFLAVGRFLRAAMLAETEASRQQHIASYLKSLGAVEAAINEARPKFVSEEGKALFAEFDRIWPSYKDGIQKTEAMVLSEPLRTETPSNNYMEGDSNKLPRSVGLSIAEHPNTTQFNPMFIYGPSGSGKTHLVNAIGLKAKQMYPQKRVLYVSARLFQTQYTDAVLHNASNDFINFYQSIDMLIVDDIQEWAGKAKTLNTFFHIFNHLFRNGKRIILACDRPPVELKDMPDRLLTRFSCGLVCELEKPNIQLCVDILSNKIRRDGLKIPVDVISFIAQTCNGSVRDLQGAINGLLAYSIVYNSSIDIRLAERVIKRAVKVDDKPLTIDDIVETVCHHYNVTVTAVNSKSRKRDYVVARQVTMYLAQKYTKMPASRIGKLVGNRDHSTVIHSCSKVEERLKIDAGFSDELVSIENGLKVKRA